MKNTLKLTMVMTALLLGANGFAGNESSSFDIKPEMTPGTAEGPLAMNDIPQGYPQENGIEMGAPGPDENARVMPQQRHSLEGSENLAMNEEPKAIEMPQQRSVDREFNPNDAKLGGDKPDTAKDLSMGGMGDTSGLPDDLKPDNLEKELSENNKGNVGGMSPEKEDLKKEFAENNVGGYPRELSQEEAEKMGKGQAGLESRREEAARMFG